MIDLIPALIFASAALLAVAIAITPLQPPRRARREPPLTRENLVPAVYGTRRASPRDKADEARLEAAKIARGFSCCHVPDEIGDAIEERMAEEIKISNKRGNHIEFELLPQMADLQTRLAEVEAERDELEGARILNRNAIARLKARAEQADELIGLARSEWLEENDPRDGTDCVTPYDCWFYGRSTE